MVFRNGTMAVRPAMVAVSALFLALSSPIAAAGAQQYKYEVRLDGGGWIPTGALADAFHPTGTIGATVSWAYSPEWAALISASWTPSQDKDPAGGMHVNIYQYDAGLEWSRKTSEYGRWDIHPYLGGGLGFRRYSPQRVTEPDQNAFDGYVSAGLSFGLERGTWRIGLRDYVSGWKGITKTESNTGNDLAVLLGMGFRF